MDIRILQLIEGAQNARGLTVVIDVFRAFTFECYAIANNAERILPVADKDLAYAMKRENPDYIVAGERFGRMLEGFDYGNSPWQIEKADFTGKTIVHTTSAGTQGLENAKQADEIITGSLVNAKAVANYIRAKNPDIVSLVCMGINAVAPAQEDDLCAAYIQSLLLGEAFDLDSGIAALRQGEGSKFFDPANSEVFPQGDFALCVDADRFPFVLRALRQERHFVIEPVWPREHGFA